MSDDRFETHVLVEVDGARRAIHFQEWWVRYRAALPAEAFVYVGADTARPGPGVLDAIAAADVVLLPPSNPVVSIGTALQVPGIREALAQKTVVGVSPIVGGARCAGMADACLDAIGVETSARRSGGTTARVERGPARRLARRHRDAGATVPGRRGAGGAAADDRPTRDAQDGPGGARPGGQPARRA
jgi:hypothetical protein